MAIFTFLKHSRWYIKWSIFILPLLVISSCVKDSFKLDKFAHETLSPTVAAPLIKSSLSIRDLLKTADKDGNITVDSNNFCTIFYKSHLFTFKASDLIKIPDQSFSQSLSLNFPPGAILPAGTTTTVSQNNTITFNPGNQLQIDSMSYKTGTLNFYVSSDFKHDVSINIQIPYAKKNGVALSQTINLPYKGTTPSIAFLNIDLKGYVFDMTQGGIATNKFDVNFSFTVTGTGNSISSNNQLLVDYGLTTILFDKLFGYIGQQSLSPQKDTIELTIFKNMNFGGNISLADPQVKLFLTNSYGVPVHASISKFDGVTSSGSTFPIIGANVPNPIPITSPTPSQIGQSFTTKLVLDNTNSNFNAVLLNRPKYIIYDISTITNPNGKIGPNFVLDSSKFNVDMEVELPLYGKVSALEIQDTVDFEFGGVDQLKSLMLRANITNGFPMDVGVQIFFTDSTYKTLDSLITPYKIIMPSAQVDNNGKVSVKTNQVTDIELSHDKLEKLKNTRKLLIRGRLNTANNGNTDVKIYTDYTLDVKMGVKAKLGL